MPAMQRTDRIAGEIRGILGEAIIREEIKDPRVRQAGMITFTHVRVTGDLREARAYFMVHGADAAALKKVQQGLRSASGYLRRIIGQKLKLKITPSLTFEIDGVFEQEAKIDRLLEEVGNTPASSDSSDDPDPARDK